MRKITDIIYPGNSINILINYATKNTDVINGYYLNHHGKLNIEQGRIYILIRGRVRIDHARTSKTLGLFVRKMLIGIVEGNYSVEDITYNCSKDTRFFIIDSYKFYSKLQEEKMLSHIIVVSNYFIAQLIARINIVMAKNSYTIIKGLIELYEGFQKTADTPKETLSYFILSRTTLSKSLVMKITSDLRKGGYIEVDENGWLTINKKLPERY